MATKNPEVKSHFCPHPGCDSAFYRPYRLLQHLLVHNNVRAFPCTFKKCSKSYTSKSHLDRHIRNAHNKKPFPEVVYRCPKCMKNYANRQNLKKHLKLHHRPKDSFVCDTCNLKFKKKNQLKSHMYLHTGVKAFNCKLCPKAFVSLCERRKHMHAHKTYSCTECSATFGHWSKYRKHFTTAHEPKEYICDVCERVFHKRIHITRHLKIHDESKIFFCPYENCKKFYTRNSNLRQHILIKHEHVKHECTICKAQLSTKKKLLEHISKRHESEPKHRTYKTKKDGRKVRKDAGTLKNSTAAMLAGLSQKSMIKQCADLKNSTGNHPSLCLKSEEIKSH